MAKGDQTTMQNTVNSQGNAVQTGINNLGVTNTGLTNQFQSNYTPAAATNTANYG